MFSRRLLKPGTSDLLEPIILPLLFLDASRLFVDSRQKYQELQLSVVAPLRGQVRNPNFIVARLAPRDEHGSNCSGTDRTARPSR
jgi:hypothetical protein